MSPIRVILADDHAVCRMGIRSFLEENEDIVVVAEAADGETAKQLIATHQPDVAILDIRMPRLTGIEVTRWIREQALPVGVLIVSAFDDDPFVKASIEAGANGYILKDADADHLVDSVRLIYKGQAALGPTILQKLMTQYAGGARSAMVVNSLTERERAVLRFVAHGLTNRGIGVQLEISDRTVQGHLASIYEKLEVNSRTEAVTKAMQLGLMELPDSTTWETT
jgi:DNA-binding NarL/FixJ family response regulator